MPRGVLKILGANDDSRCFLGPVVKLAGGASSDFSVQLTTLSVFRARRDAGAWSVLEIRQFPVLWLLPVSCRNYVITPSGMHTLFTHMLEFQMIEIRNILVAVMFQNCFENFPRVQWMSSGFLNFLAADACMQWFCWSGKFLSVKVSRGCCLVYRSS